MAEADEIPEELMRAARRIAYVVFLDGHEQDDLSEAIASALMAERLASEARGREKATAELAEMLKNPAAVLVNWKRGEIDASSIVREAKAEQKEADAELADCIADERDVMAMGAAADSQVAVYRAQESTANRIASAIRNQDSKLP